MSLKEFKLAYGHGTQSVMLPEEHISDVLEGVPTPACDVKEATIECMRHPIGAEPLHDLVKKGDKVASSSLTSPAHGTALPNSPSTSSTN